MNLPPPSTGTTIHHDRQSESAPERRRSVLLFARIVCAVVATLGVGLFVATLPTYFAYLLLLCAPVSCIYGQLTMGSTPALHSLGLSLKAYAVLNLTLVIMSGLLSFPSFPTGSLSRVGLAGWQSL